MLHSSPRHGQPAGIMLQLLIIRILCVRPPLPMCVPDPAFLVPGAQHSSDHYLSASSIDSTVKEHSSMTPSAVASVKCTGLERRAKRCLPVDTGQCLACSKACTLPSMGRNQEALDELVTPCAMNECHQMMMQP